MCLYGILSSVSIRVKKTFCSSLFLFFFYSKEEIYSMFVLRHFFPEASPLPPLKNNQIEFCIKNWNNIKPFQVFRSPSQRSNLFTYRLLIFPKGSKNNAEQMGLFLEVVLDKIFPFSWCFPSVECSLLVANFDNYEEKSIRKFITVSFCAEVMTAGSYHFLSISDVSSGFLNPEGSI
ncbi:hypothetical protein IE077_003588, partial [Cardiosporidium cionae]